jgi:riboflavin kinase/FMN adenylyltransferase
LKTRLAPYIERSARQREVRQEQSMSTPRYRSALQRLAAALTAAPVVTIGNFDGAHLGHRAIFDALRAEATPLQAPTLALSFEPHPVLFFGKKDPATFCLTSPEQKIDLLRAAGIDVPALIPFDQDLAGLSPEAFVREFLHEHLGARSVRVGYDFNFGKGRAGGVEELRRYGEALGIAVHVQEAVRWGGEVVSSTRVRGALSAGALEEAEALLGRAHSLVGVVAQGQRLGRQLAAPTANLHPEAGMMARHGVYLTQARVLDEAGARWWPSISNLGQRPTLGEALQPNLETMVLDAPEGLDLYERPLEVALLRFLRPEARFDAVEALRAQIAEDVARARALHGL